MISRAANSYLDQSQHTLSDSGKGGPQFPLDNFFRMLWSILGHKQHTVVGSYLVLPILRQPNPVQATQITRQAGFI